MIIALDWDNTFTRDTDMWQDLILAAEYRGHTVYIVTSRDMDTPIEFIPEGIKNIIYCASRAKEEVVKEWGLKIDVWIDDDPLYIIKGFVDDEG